MEHSPLQLAFLPQLLTSTSPAHPPIPFHPFHHPLRISGCRQVPRVAGLVVSAAVHRSGHRGLPGERLRVDRGEVPTGRGAGARQEPPGRVGTGRTRTVPGALKGRAA